MKIELTEFQIRNTLYFLGLVDLRGSKADVLMAMSLLLRLYEGALERTESTLPAVDADPPKKTKKGAKD